MAIIPIKLDGGNLGERHKYLNCLVNEAFQNNIDFVSIKDLQENSPVDKLFKIDLASKYRNVDYILDTLKDNDLIYVSRALKCLWLIQDPEYSNIINPTYLEKELFPDMLITSVNKMKKWILLNLKDKNVCQSFYEFYKEKDMRFALKFLPKCTSEFITREISKIPVNEVTPNFLKLICEQSPQLAELHFKDKKDKTRNHEISEPINNDQYVNRLQFLLKTDPDTYFYVIENIYDVCFKRLNKKATKYIMKNHRNRFESKPAFYVARLLNLSVIPKFLNNEQMKELVIKCAQAEYIGYYWFSYQFAEPLLKNMNAKERSEFCKKVFIEKSIGEKVTKPPYYIPSSSNDYDSKNDFSSEVFDRDYDEYLNSGWYYRHGKMARCYDMRERFLCSAMCKKSKLPTLLDKLFDQNRFLHFEEVFAEFSSRIPKESILTVRQNLLLVLVSKTGGREDRLEKLINFLITRHSNEAVSLRATIVRSLVKRACVWRLKGDSWDKLLKFGRDMGLDGSQPVIACREGIHAVVLHDLLETGSCTDAVFTSFLKEFSTLTEYSLKRVEKEVLLKTLPKLMLNKVDTEPDKAAECLNQLLNVLSAFKFPIDQCSDVVSSISSFFARDPDGGRPVLQRLYNARVARKELFKENFEIIQTDESYLNALRHDSKILISGEHFDKLLLLKPPECHERFLKKLSIYFNKDTQIVEHFQNSLMSAIATKPHAKLARTAALLANTGATWPVSVEGTGSAPKKLQIELRRVSHLVKSHSAIDDWNSKERNMIKIANWIHKCSDNSLREQMPKLLADPRLARLVLALRTPIWPGFICQTMLQAVKYRPSKTVRVAIHVLRRHGERFYQNQDWEALKIVLMKINLKNKKSEYYRYLAQINPIPKTCRLDYCLIVCEFLEKIGFDSDKAPHYHTAIGLLHYINDNIDKINEEYIEKVTKHFLGNYQAFDKFDKEHYTTYVSLYGEIISRFILLGKTELQQKTRFAEIGTPYLKRAFAAIESSKENRDSRKILLKFINSLKYTKLYLDSESCVFIPQIIKDFFVEYMPIVKYFEIHCHLRITLLYGQALKQCLAENPSSFEGKRIKNTESVQLIAFTFGKIIAHDIEELVLQYFQSIRQMYFSGLNDYVWKNIISRNKIRQEIFLAHLIKGLTADRTKTNGVLAGLYIYHHSYDEFADLKEEMKNLGESSVEVKYFINP